MNPNYERLRNARKIVVDCYQGTDAIKGNFGAWENPSEVDAFRYLPPTNRELNEEIKNRSNPFKKTSYRTRLEYAVYENFFRSIIDDVVGVMQKNEPTIQFRADGDLSKSAPELVDLLYFGNAQNDGLRGLKARLNKGQVLFGRYGLALDVSANEDDSKPRFKVVEYDAASILDGELEKGASGRVKTRWVLCDETYYRFDYASKQRVKTHKYRVFGLDSNEEYYQASFEGVFSEVVGWWASFDVFNPGKSAIYPTFRGRRLDFVPFVVCNVDRLGVDVWQEPPYLDVARVAIANYQIDSIHKKAMFNFSSPTLLIKNVPTAENVFLGDALILDSSGSANDADARILETSGAGLRELREAKTEIKTALRFTSIRDLFSDSGASSSAKALSLRADSGTATVASIDKTGARAIESVIIHAARWLGWSIDEIGDSIKYEVNTSYLSDDFNLQSITSLLTADGAENPLLSRRQKYRLVNKASGDMLDSFDDNERQLLGESEI